MSEKHSVEVTIDDKAVKMYVVKPNNDVISGAERYRAKIWTECVAEGVFTKKELTKLMIKKGLWSKDQEEAEKNLINSIKFLEKKLYLGDGSGKKPRLSEGKNTAIEIRRARIELRNLMMEKVNQEENTAEALADNARFDYLVAGCSFYENGEKVYKDVTAYNAESAGEKANALAAELAKLLYALDSNFEASLPENQWLSRHNLVNKELSLVNREGHLVDLDGRTINEHGQFVDTEGNLTDGDGNPVSDKGIYANEIEYEDDLGVMEDKEAQEAQVTPRKTKRQKTATNTTDS